MLSCLHCKTSLSFRKNTANKYCNNKCQAEHQGKQKVADWLAGKIPATKSIVTRYLKETVGYSCDVCQISEWNGESLTLEIDHIDGDSCNNEPSNFRYLCPNCHAQTSSYKGRNRGKGRPKQTKNYTIQPC